MNFARFRSLLPRCGHTCGDRGAVPPNAPKTPKHGVRVEEDLWQAALRKAHDEGRTLTEVIVECLKRFLRD